MVFLENFPGDIGTANKTSGDIMSEFVENSTIRLNFRGDARRVESAEYFRTDRQDQFVFEVLHQGQTQIVGSVVLAIVPEQTGTDGDDFLHGITRNL